MPLRTIYLPVRNDLRVSIMALANSKIYNFVSVTLSTLHISNEIKKSPPFWVTTLSEVWYGYAKES